MSKYVYCPLAGESFTNIVQSIGVKSWFALELWPGSLHYKCVAMAAEIWLGLFLFFSSRFISVDTKRHWRERTRVTARRQALSHPPPTWAPSWVSGNSFHHGQGRANSRSFWSDRVQTVISASCVGTYLSLDQNLWLDLVQQLQPAPCLKPGAAFMKILSNFFKVFHF